MTIKKEDLLQLLPITAVSVPAGYEAVWGDKGNFYSCPIVAITFQNSYSKFNVTERLDDNSCHPIISVMWEIHYSEGVVEVDVYHEQFIGIKDPSQTIEEIIALRASNK